MKKTNWKGPLHYAISGALLFFAVICFLGILTIFCNVIQDMGNINNWARGAYQKITDSEMTDEQMTQIKVLEDVYKNSRTHDIMSFFYLFIALVMIGMGAYFYNNFLPIIAEYKKRLEDEKETLEAKRMTFKKIEGLSEYSELINCVSMISDRLNILMLLFLQTRTKKKFEDLITHNFPRLREDLAESNRILGRIEQNKNEMTGSYRQLLYVHDCFEEFEYKVEALYKVDVKLVDKSTKDEFIKEIDKCKGILKKINKNKQNMIAE